MKKISFHNLRAVIEEAPVPAAGDNEVLVKVERSCIVPGFETVLSVSGIVLEAGNTVHDIFPGDIVACAGAPGTQHAEIICVTRNLLVPVPEELGFDEAATVAFGAIALQGVRRAGPSLGEIIAVIGLGLIGQLTAQLLKANGCRVIGCDADDSRIRCAGDFGMDYGFNHDKSGTEHTPADFTGGTGIDGIIVTAPGSEKNTADIFQLCRKHGRIVSIGDMTVGTNPSDLAQKEPEISLSTFFGPGRYEQEYEGKNIDFPISYVRWTENRNMREYLQLIADGKVSVESLTGDAVPIADAADAFVLSNIAADNPLKTILSWPESDAVQRPVKRMKSPSVADSETQRVRIALIGAGGFAKAVHLPNIKQLGELYSLQAVVSASQDNADAAAQEFGAQYSTTEYRKVLEDSSIDAVCITTRHNLHAEMTAEALKAGKHVLVEKPLALNHDELDTIRNVIVSFGDGKAPLLMTGFNRRFSPFACRIHELTKDRANPLMMNYRMNAGHIPLDHWVHTAEGGGRNIGEACHIYDLFTYLTGAEVRSVEVNSVKPSDESISNRNNFIATVTFADGSVAALVYTALGSADYPKEKLEVYCDNKALVLDNYNELVCYGVQDSALSYPGDKGHLRELRAFAEAVIGGGGWPIPLWQQFQAMETAFEVDRLLIG